MKQILLIAVVLFFSGCQAWEEHRTKNFKENLHRICIDGREFLILDVPGRAGITQIIGDDGKPLKCESEK